VAADHVELLGVERRGLVQHTVGHRDLAHVVQQRDPLDVLHRARAETQGAGNPAREGDHAARVSTRGAVAGLDGAQKGTQTHRLGVLAPALDLLLLAIELVGDHPCQHTHDREVAVVRLRTARAGTADERPVHAPMGRAHRHAPHLLSRARAGRGELTGPHRAQVGDVDVELLPRRGQRVLDRIARVVHGDLREELPHPLGLVQHALLLPWTV